MVRLSVVAAAAVLAEALVDAGLGAVTVRLRGTGVAWRLDRSVRPVVIATVPLYAPVIVILAYAYQEVSAWTMPLFFAPALGAHRLFARSIRPAGRGSQPNERLERANLSFASALVATLDARDQYTAGHSADRCASTRGISQTHGSHGEMQQLAYVCGLVHDIGKIGLPPGLLDKPGRTDSGRAAPDADALRDRRGILRKVDDYGDIAKIVRHHHERFDGEGYPDRIAGDEIPPVSRIIAVADAYNAMTSDRPYRDAMPSRVARVRLAQAVESQFDTAVVAAFEAILTSATDEYRAGIFDGAPVGRPSKDLRLPEVPALVGLPAYAS